MELTEYYKKENKVVYFITIYDRCYCFYNGFYDKEDAIQTIIEDYGKFTINLKNFLEKCIWSKIIK